MENRSLRQLQGLDVRQAFTFPFDDPDWPQKLWLGGLLAAIPVVGWLLLSAYTLRALRWVALDQTATLPQWRRRDLKRMLVEGLRFFAVTILVIVTIVCPIALLVALWTTLGGDLPDLDRFRSVSGVPWLYQTTEARVLGVMYAAVTTVAQARLAVTESIWAACRPDQVVATLFAAPVAWLAAAIVVIAFSAVEAQLVWHLNPAGWGTWATDTLLTIAAGVYTGLVSAHLAGQAARLARRKLARQALAVYR